MKFKIIKYMIVIFLLSLFIKEGLGGFCEAYFFGLKSADNTITNIQKIEKKYDLKLPIIAFIFDPRSQESINTLKNLTTELGKNRIYHITLAPNNFSAKQVAEGKFDAEYQKFFKIIKEQKLKVIFRTMHEMNGGRYPRSSDPTNFKKARIRVWNLAREEGLDQSNILFDFSVNHRDMPTKGVPSQTAKLIQCQPATKKAKACFTFEDYYPGNQYVDIMGFTFYNRGKASYNRAWIAPAKIVNQAGRNTLSRLKKYQKPIFIDEVATTAVRYGGAYDQMKSIQAYQYHSVGKNLRLQQLKTLLNAEPSIVGAIYFNVDFTHGLTERPIGEADRSAINLENNKVYTGIFDLIDGSEKLEHNNQLLPLFNIQLLQINGIQKFIQSDHIRIIKRLLKMTEHIDKKLKADELIDTLYQKGIIKSLYKNYDTQELQEIVQATKEFILE